MTKFPKLAKREMHTIDAAGVSVGRLASQCARLLIGKHRVSYAPHMDSGDGVLVRHIDKAHWTGNKLSLKHYYRHSGRPGGLKAETLKTTWAKNPVKALEHAVWRMLPKTRHRKSMFRRLKVEG